MPALLGQAAVVGHDRLLAEAVGHLPRHALDEAACVDEDQRGLVGLHELSNIVERLTPHLVGRYGAQLVFGEPQLQVHRPPVAGVDDRALCVAGGIDVRAADQEPRDLVDGPLGGGQPDSRDRVVRKLAQALHGKAQVGAALVSSDGVQLVEDEGPDAPEALASALRREQDVERLGGRDQYVRRPLGHRLPLFGRRVAGPHRDANLLQRRALGLGQGGDLRQRLREVATDVVGQRLERGYVDHLGALGQAAIEASAHEAVDAGHEGCKRLARPGRGRDQRVPALGYGGPAGFLGVRGGLEALVEPALDQGMEPLRHRHSCTGKVCRADYSRSARNTHPCSDTVRPLRSAPPPTFTGTETLG